MALEAVNGEKTLAQIASEFGVHPNQVRQYKLIGLSRTSYYYGSSRDDEYNLELMRLLDEQYTKVPFYGVRRLTAWLRAQGYIVNPKRVRVLMFTMWQKQWVWMAE